MTLEDDDVVLLFLMTWSFDGGLDDALEAWMMSWLMEVLVLFFSTFYR